MTLLTNDDIPYELKDKLIGEIKEYEYVNTAIHQFNPTGDKWEIKAIQIELDVTADVDMYIGRDLSTRIVKIKEDSGKNFYYFYFEEPLLLFSSMFIRTMFSTNVDLKISVYYIQSLEESLIS